MAVCSQCNRREPDFEETDICSPCADLIVFPQPQALAWTSAARTEIRRILRDLLQSRPQGYEQACAAQLDGWVVVKTGDQIAVNHIAWGAAEALSEAYGPPGNGEDVTPEEAVRTTLTMSRDIAALNELEHLLKQGTRALVEVPSDKIGTATQFQPACFTFPKYAAWNYRSQAWTRWTQVGLHAGPDSTRDEPTFAEALVRSDPRASIYANLMRFNLPVAPINALSEIQAFKRYANRIPPALEKLDSEGASRLRFALHDLVGPEGQVPYEAHVTGTSAGLELEATAPQQTRELVRKLSFGTASPIASLFLPSSDGAFWFSPEMAQGLQRIAFNYAQLPTGQQMSKFAGDTFESLVSELLRALGYTTTHKGVRLTGFSATKKSEVDVIAWSTSRFFLIEAKCEMENPGAWADASKQVRIDQVEDYRSKLEAKSQVWEAVLKSKNPTIYDAKRQPLDLPKGLLDERKLSLALISIRVESRPAGGLVPVYTYMPTMATEVGRRRLAPTDRFAAFWDGESDLP